MNNSVRPWCNIPIVLHKFAGFKMSGDKNQDVEKTIYCYITEEVTPIVDKNGKEYVSTTQMYTSEDTIVADMDKIVYNNKSFEIRKLSVYRDGKTGNVDLQVIYL